MSVLTGTEGATAARQDPPLTHNFLVMLSDTSSPSSPSTAGVASLQGDALFGEFSEVEGLRLTQEVESRHEGGLNGTERRFPTRLTWGNLVLVRGVSRISQGGWDWLSGFGDGRVRRMDGLVVLLDARRTPHNIWRFRRGLPVRYDGPRLRGTANEVAVETLEIAHEGLVQLPVLALGAERVSS
jgi:phage tail-like protein